MKTFHTDVAVLTQRLFKLERIGRYDEAFAELKNIWDEAQQRPQVEDLPPFIAAEVLLRSGALIGFLGHVKQIPESQERSRDLLTEARKRFLEIGSVEKVAETENYLALAYWRTGELVEAETWIEETLFRELPDSSQTRLYAYIIRCLIFFQLKKIEENLEFFQEQEDNFINFGSDGLKGDFYNHYGLTLRNLGRKAEALEKYELARHYHQRSGHQIYLGTIENNIAYLYKSEGQFAEAHAAIDSATKIFRQIKDRTREGFSLDTKAAIFCDEEKHEEALRVIERAIAILRKSENAAYLCETLLTKAKVLIYLDDLTAAFLNLSEAVQIARTQMSEDAAAKLASQFEAALEEKKNPRPSKTPAPAEPSRGRTDLELVLPHELAHYEEFQGVWIKNSYFENIGLRQGSLAVVTNEKIVRGDLVAVLEIASDSVICGYYDSEFGIVCLEGIGEEPLLFDDKEIKILGKVIGVGHMEKSSNGKMPVEPIKL